MCQPSVDDSQCGLNASCKPIQGQGICTYDDVGPSPGPAPPSPPSPPSPPAPPAPPFPPGLDCFTTMDQGDCEAKATEGCHWCDMGLCLPQDFPCHPGKKVLTFIAAKACQISYATGTSPHWANRDLIGEYSLYFLLLFLRPFFSMLLRNGPGRLKMGL